MRLLAKLMTVVALALLGVNLSTTYAADSKLGDSDQWRYVFHDGQWWYWLPEGRWVYWEDGRWQLPEPSLSHDGSGATNRLPWAFYGGAGLYGLNIGPFYGRAAGSWDSSWQNDDIGPFYGRAASSGIAWWPR
ncbi:MAG: hypothetical protein ABFC63_00270 [Thermoguttaceae bacterium]